MADDLAMVARVYDLAGQPLDDDARAAMTRFMADHPRGKFGAVDYDLAAFGLDPGALRRQMAFYTERFGVTAGVLTRPSEAQRMTERRMRPQRRATCTTR